MKPLLFRTLAAVTAVTLGCAQTAPTELVVRIDSDLCAATNTETLESVRVEVLSDPPDETLFDSSFRVDRYFLPGEVVLAATEDNSTRVIRVTVVGLLRSTTAGSMRSLERQYRARFSPGRRTVLDVFLSAQCLDAPACEGRTTCGPSGCESIDRPWLPDWSPAQAPRACGSSSLDAGTPDDASEPPTDVGCSAGTTRCGATCRDVTRDPSNCGRCGAVCAPSNATGVCSAGRCALGTCRDGWANCDGVATNGCEVDLSTNAQHCGRCDNRCASNQCTAGTCGVTEPVILSGFGGSTGFGPDEQCLHPSDEDAWSGPPPVGAMPTAQFIPLRFAFSRGLELGSFTLTQMLVNTNGTVSFVDPVPAYQATNAARSTQPVLAPWWSDVDTRTGGFPSRNAICFGVRPGIIAVTWYKVGFYDRHDTLQNTFQVVMREVSTPADWDLEFRYAQCQWVSGDFSGGTNGHGGTTAIAGLVPGDSLPFIPLPNSGTPTVDRLCTTTNTAQPGVWKIRVRHGDPAL